MVRGGEVLLHSFLYQSLKECFRNHPYAQADSAQAGGSTYPVPGGNNFFDQDVPRDRGYPEKIHPPCHKQ